jgi:hypothetical protein
MDGWMDYCVWDGVFYRFPNLVLINVKVLWDLPTCWRSRMCSALTGVELQCYLGRRLLLNTRAVWRICKEIHWILLNRLNRPLCISLYVCGYLTDQVIIHDEAGNNNMNMFLRMHIFRIRTLQLPGCNELAVKLPWIERLMTRLLGHLYVPTSVNKMYQPYNIVINISYLLSTTIHNIALEYKSLWFLNIWVLSLFRRKERCVEYVNAV